MDANIDERYYYNKDHEWVYIEDNVATVGISDYAQEALGDITFIELPQVGSEVEQFEELTSVESVKAASDIYAPMSGKVIEVHSDLEADPSLINKSCYDKGWIVKLQISDPDEQSNLMSPQEYEQYLEGLE